MRSLRSELTVLPLHPFPWYCCWAALQSGSSVQVLWAGARQHRSLVLGFVSQSRTIRLHVASDVDLAADKDKSFYPEGCLLILRRPQTFGERGEADSLWPPRSCLARLLPRSTTQSRHTPCPHPPACLPPPPAPAQQRSHRRGHTHSSPQHKDQPHNYDALPFPKSQEAGWEEEGTPHPFFHLFTPKYTWPTPIAKPLLSAPVVRLQIANTKPVRVGESLAGGAPMHSDHMS